MNKLPSISACALLLASTALADENHAVHQDGAITSAPDASKVAAFDILAAHAHSDGRLVTFHMTTNGSPVQSNPIPQVSLVAHLSSRMSGQPRWIPRPLGLKGTPGYLHLPQQAIRILTTRRFLTKTTTATRPMMGCYGTAIGLC